MSGGHWNYVGAVIRDSLETIARDDEAGRWPITRALFAALAPVLTDAEHEMDWDLSADSLIPGDATWDRATAGKVLDAVLRPLPDEWFPRGKWATIQALQGRVAVPPAQGMDQPLGPWMAADAATTRREVAENIGALCACGHVHLADADGGDGGCAAGDCKCGRWRAAGQARRDAP